MDGWKECLRELTHRTISIRKARCQLRLDQEYGEAERGESERWKGGEMKRWKGGEVKRWKGGQVDGWTECLREFTHRTISIRKTRNASLS